MFSGIITALVTPFKNGSVDFESLQKLVQQQLDQGIDGFVISGTTGESPTITDSEKKSVYQAVRAQVKEKVPLIVGTGSNCTRSTIEFTKEVESWGADGALVVVPYYNKPPQKGLVAHFKAVAENTQLPIILYNVPSRTVTSLSLDSIVELSKVSNIVGIKEASADINLAAAISEQCGSDFLLSSGDDEAYLRVIASGGRGVISVASHLLADKMKDWSKRVQAGDESAHGEFALYKNLIDLLFVEANPIPVKEALQEMGILSSAEVRLPLCEMSKENRARLIAEMRSLELL